MLCMLTVFNVIFSLLVEHECTLTTLMNQIIFLQEKILGSNYECHLSMPTVFSLKVVLVTETLSVPRLICNNLGRALLC